MNWRDFQKDQRVLEIGDEFISYVDKGAGEPLVLIHGIPTWGYLWQPVLERLAENYRVLVPDLMGFGFSSKADRFDRSLERQTRWLDEWLIALGVEQAHLVGHDIGGGVALRMGTCIPERVKTLTLINSVCYDSWPIELMLQLGHPRAYEKASAATTVKMLRKALQLGFHKSPSRSDMDGLLAPYGTEVGKLSLMRNAAALNTNQTQELTPLLPHTFVPTLILWGEDDPFQDVRYADRLGRDLPMAQPVRFARARHFSLWDRPQALTEEIEIFLHAHAVRPAQVAGRAG